MITPKKTYDCPVAKCERGMNYIRSEGFMYEIAAVRDSLLKGLFSEYRRLSGWLLSRHRMYHDDVIKWKHFPRYWPFVRGIHRWPVNSPHKGQWRGALVFSLIYAWTYGWVNNREAGDLRSHRAHYDVAVVLKPLFDSPQRFQWY